MKKTAEEVAASRAALLDHLKPGDTVYTILRDVSRSGMSRKISLLTFKDGRPVWLSYSASNVLGLRLNKNGSDSVTVGGCGMDMGFHLVYNLGRVLWPGGLCDGSRNRKCKTKTPHGPVLGSTDKHHTYTDSGYALKHQWL